MECCCVFAVHPLISRQAECVNSTLPPHLILPRSIDPIVIISPELKARMHTRSINWLIECCSMSATPPSYMACGVTMVTHELEAPVRRFIDGYYNEGQSGQEKTDLEVRNTDWRRDVASAIQLESSFYQMSHCSVCRPVSVHQGSSQKKDSTCCHCVSVIGKYLLTWSQQMATSGVFKVDSFHCCSLFDFLSLALNSASSGDSVTSSTII